MTKITGGITQTLLLITIAFRTLQAFTFHEVARGCQPFLACTGSSSTCGRILPVLFAAERNPEDLPQTPESAAQKPNDVTQSHLANDAQLSSRVHNNPTWDQNIAALLEYNQTYGTVNLPVGSKEFPNLGLWVRGLRQKKFRLTKDEVHQLESIGFLWKDSVKDKQDKKWHEMFSRLKAYKERYGDCLVSSTYKEDKQLGVWVSYQRRLNTQKKIRQDRKELLQSIGFVWRLKEFFKRDRPEYEELWEERYQELVEFKKQNGHTNVIVINGPDDKKSLGRWVDNQRKRYKDGLIRQDRQKKLEELEFVWEFQPFFDKSWLEQFEEYKVYYQNLALSRNADDGRVANAREPGLEKDLKWWSCEQRRINSAGNMDPQRKDMLDEIGFEWWE